MTSRKISRDISDDAHVKQVFVMNRRRWIKENEVRADDVVLLGVIYITDGPHNTEDYTEQDGSHVKVGDSIFEHPAWKIGMAALDSPDACRQRMRSLNTAGGGGEFSAYYARAVYESPRYVEDKMHERYGHLRKGNSEFFHSLPLKDAVDFLNTFRGMEWPEDGITEGWVKPLKPARDRNDSRKTYSSKTKARKNKRSKKKASKKRVGKKRVGKKITDTIKVGRTKARNADKHVMHVVSPDKEEQARLAGKIDWAGLVPIGEYITCDLDGDRARIVVSYGGVEYNGGYHSLQSITIGKAKKAGVNIKGMTANSHWRAGGKLLSTRHHHKRQLEIKYQKEYGKQFAGLEFDGWENDDPNNHAIWKPLFNNSRVGE